MPSHERHSKIKWVFKIKLNTAGRVTRYKDRLVVCGYAKKYGRDYGETFGLDRVHPFPF